MFVRLASFCLFFGGVAVAAINWKSVWLEPRTPVVLITVGETKPFTVIGLNGANAKADLTKSQYLKITSSHSDILEIDPANGTFIGKKPGHADIRLSFSDASEMVPAFVRPARTDRSMSQNTPGLDGVWRAVFTGPEGQRPKMVSEIVFTLDSTGTGLTGIVHAAYWPGDAPVTDGRIDGEKVTFKMTGRLSFHANGIEGYPKLCFTGVRNGDEMKIDLDWTEARSPCDQGSLLSMVAKRVAD